MLYEYKLDVPANTEKAEPEEKEMLITVGILVKVDIFMPDGSVGLCHAVVKDGQFQIMPINAEGDIATNGILVTGIYHYEIKSGHQILTLKGWNEDDTYSHEITCRLNVMKKEELATTGPLDRLSKALSRMLGLD